ncbi:MAG: PRC-barrel domain-containing protein [Acetobacteraceae bacterium]|nr:PRC-barrel domain-containing protein [Acetobacteraceae bacterium]
MLAGALTGHIDTAQLVFAGFCVFFLGLVYYLRQQDKREGYPLEDPSGKGQPLVGFPFMPGPKTFRTMKGDTVSTPRAGGLENVPAVPRHNFPGSPLDPVADPVVDGLGPASFAAKREAPLEFTPGKLQLQPMRVLDGEWSVTDPRMDPRGMAVIGSDNVVAGMVADIWIDRGVKILRYLEVELRGSTTARNVLIPIYSCDVNARRRCVRLPRIPAAALVDVPTPQSPTQITAREEDRINAFFTGAAFYRGSIRRSALA